MRTIMLPLGSIRMALSAYFADIRGLLFSHPKRLAPVQTDQDPPAVRWIPRRRFGRRAVAFGLLAFVVAQLGFTLLIQNSSLGIRDEQYASLMMAIQKCTAEKPKTLNVVLFGTSRTQMGVCAPVVKHQLVRELSHPVCVTSFAGAGRGIQRNLFQYRRLERDGIRPDLVVFEVLMPFLTSSYLVDGEWNDANLPISQLTWDELEYLETRAAAFRPGIRQEWLLSAGLPLYERRMAIMSRIMPSWLPPEKRILPYCDEGIQADLSERPITADRRQIATAKARDTYYPILHNFRIGGAATEALREFLGSCRDRGIRVALLLMPEGANFQSWYPDGVREQARSWLYAQAQEFGASVIDASNWYRDEDMYDSHHLTNVSSYHISQRLGREVLAPILQQQLKAAK